MAYPRCRGAVGRGRQTGPGPPWHAERWRGGRPTGIGRSSLSWLSWWHQPATPGNSIHSSHSVISSANQRNQGSGWEHGGWKPQSIISTSTTQCDGETQSHVHKGGGDILHPHRDGDPPHPPGVAEILHFGTKPGHFKTSKIHFPTSERSERASK